MSQHLSPSKSVVAAATASFMVALGATLAPAAAQTTAQTTLQAADQTVATAGEAGKVDNATPGASPAAAAPVLAALAEGDAAAGKRVFAKCMACHTVNEGQHRVGPSLYGIVGRTAGTVEGFRNYSPANKDSGVVWTADVLFDYLENPQAFMPGTRMVFPGLPSEKDRADLIAYLQSASE